MKSQTTAMNSMSQFYITKNGKGDLAVMSLETYEKLVGKYELTKLINAGLESAEKGKVRSFKESLNDLRKEFK